MNEVKMSGFLDRNSHYIQVTLQRFILKHSISCYFHLKRLYSIEIVIFHGNMCFNTSLTFISSESPTTEATVSLTLFKNSHCLAFPSLLSMAQQSWVFQSHVSQSKPPSTLNLSGLNTKLSDKTPSQLPTALLSTVPHPQPCCNNIF